MGIKQISVFAALMVSSTYGSATRDETYNSTLASCLEFAAQFDNTCTDLENAVDYDSVPTQDASCTMPDTATCPASGTVSGTTCTFTRKLCMTCRDDDGTIKIKAQTNSMPSHCLLEGDGVLDVMSEFETWWLPEDPEYTSDDYADIFLKSIGAKVPSANKRFDETGDVKINPGWGVAKTGATIGAIEETDEFARMDTCLAHENSDGRYHYHFPSPCVADGTISEELKNSDSTLANAEEDILQQQKDIYRQNLKYRSVFGLAKDGRPIYTPYYDDKKTYKKCDVDLCNGLIIGDHYAYVSTFYYPYYIACYGSGSVDPQDTHQYFPDEEDIDARSCGFFERMGATQLKTIGAVSLLMASVYA